MNSLVIVPTAMMPAKTASNTAMMYAKTVRISLMTNGMTTIIMMIIMAAQLLWPAWPLDLRPVPIT